jgi:hypothetical protein
VPTLRLTQSIDSQPDHYRVEIALESDLYAKRSMSIFNLDDQNKIMPICDGTWRITFNTLSTQGLRLAPV